MSNPATPPVNDVAASGKSAGRWILLASAVSSGVLLGLTFFAGPLVLDECGTYWVVDSEVPSTVWERGLNYSAVPPLSSWVDQACIALAGKQESVFRLPSILFAYLAIFVVYLVGRELRNPITGGVAALLLAWHPEALDEVRIARCYGLVLLLSSLVLWATIRWWKSGMSWKYAAIWGLVSSALLWTHYTSALLIAICAAITLISSFSVGSARGAALATVLITLAIVGGLCVPLIPPLLRLVEWGPALNYSPQPTSLANLRNVIGPIWWAGLPAGLVATWLLSRRDAANAAADRRTLWVVAACAVLPLLILSVLSLGSLSSLASPRYRLACVPAGACLMAVIFTSARGWIAPVLGAAVTLLVAWVLSPALPWELVRLSNTKDVEWHEINIYIARNSTDGEPILVQSGLTEGHLVPAFADDRLFMEYVACRVTRFYVDSPHPRYALPFVWSEPTGMVPHFRELLRDWRNEPGGFWVAAATDTDLNQNSINQIVQLAESTGYEVIDARGWPSAMLLRFAYRESAGH